MDGRATRPLSVPTGSLERLRHRATEAAPREACGLLLGSEAEVHEVVTIPNAATTTDSFVLDPDVAHGVFERADRAGIGVVGVWHSHPAGPARPSARDIAEGVPGWVHLVVGADGAVRAWDVVDGTPRERPVVERGA